MNAWENVIVESPSLEITETQLNKFMGNLILLVVCWAEGWLGLLELFLA